MGKFRPNNHRENWRPRKFEKLVITEAWWLRAAKYIGNGLLDATVCILFVAFVMIAVYGVFRMAGYGWTKGCGDAAPNVVTKVVTYTKL